MLLAFHNLHQWENPLKSSLFSHTTMVISVPMLIITHVFLILSFPQHAVFRKEGTAISLLKKKQRSGTWVVFRLLLKEKYIFYSSGQEQTIKKLQI